MSKNNDGVRWQTPPVEDAPRPVSDATIARVCRAEMATMLRMLESAGKNNGGRLCRSVRAVLGIMDALESPPSAAPAEPPHPQCDGFLCRTSSDAIPLPNGQHAHRSVCAKPATRHTDAEIREAVRGKQTPDGRSVRWVAWDYAGTQNGFCHVMHFSPVDKGGDFYPSEGLDIKHHDDLDDPARAGTALFVGEGADPREQGAPYVRCVSDGLVYTSNPPQYRCRNCGRWWRCDDPKTQECERPAPTVAAPRAADAGELPTLVGPTPTYSDVSREWERIAREERDARLRERFQHRVDAEELVRERDAAQETAARLAVERNELRAQYEDLKGWGEETLRRLRERIEGSK